MTDKLKNILKYGGIVSIIIGTGAMYLGGATEDMTMSLVAGVFVIAGVITGIIKK